MGKGKGRRERRRGSLGWFFEEGGFIPQPYHKVANSRRGGKGGKETCAFLGEGEGGGRNGGGEEILIAPRKIGKKVSFIWGEYSTHNLVGEEEEGSSLYPPLH